jgi:hypothetical protein
LLWTGAGPLTVDLRRASANDAARAERRIMPLTLALLVVAFGAVIAAALPIAAGALSIAITMGITAIIARHFPLSVLVVNVSTMLGLGLGIDYALLTVSRFRRAAPRSDRRPRRTRRHTRKEHSSQGHRVSGYAALLLVPFRFALDGGGGLLGAHVGAGGRDAAAVASRRGRRRWSAAAYGVPRSTRLAAVGIGVVRRPIVVLAACTWWLRGPCGRRDDSSVDSRR